MQHAKTARDCEALLVPSVFVVAILVIVGLTCLERPILGQYHADHFAAGESEATHCVAGLSEGQAIGFQNEHNSVDKAGERRRIGKAHYRAGVEDDERILFAILCDEVTHLLRGENFRRVGWNFANRQDFEVLVQALHYCGFEFHVPE
jgi:hypothetical protein